MNEWEKIKRLNVRSDRGMEGWREGVLGVCDIDSPES